MQLDFCVDRTNNYNMMSCVVGLKKGSHLWVRPFDMQENVDVRVGFKGGEILLG